MSTNNPINRISSDKFNMPEKEEKHELQCRGLWTPIDLWNMCYEDKIISPMEKDLATYIDGLVRTKGEGCWASNAHLAEKFSVDERWIRRMINHLKELGVLKHVGYKMIRNLKYRVLETQWSRVETTPGPQTPPTPGPQTPPTPGPQTPQIDNSMNSANRKRTHRDAASQQSLATLSEGMLVPMGKKQSTNTTIEKLEIAISETIRIPKRPVAKMKLVNKHEEIRKLIESLQGNPQEIWDNINWLKENITKIKEPTISSVKQFCSPQIFNWVTDLRGKSHQRMNILDGKRGPKSELRDDQVS